MRLRSLQAVLGDNGRLYVAADVIPLYRELLCSANIITPNWFEEEYVPSL
jgi:pyridoxine kinase